MAEPSSQEECIERHRAYSIDVRRRLNTMQRRRLREMVAPIGEGEEVLDVGCNTGYIVDFLPKGCQVYGVDVSEEFVRVAGEHFVEAKIAPAEELPFLDKSMDVIVLGEILEHVYDPVAVVREACRVARRLVVGSTPHEDGKWGPKGTKPPETHRFHVRCFTEAELRKTLVAGGLEDVRFVLVDRMNVPQIRVFHGTVREDAVDGDDQHRGKAGLDPGEVGAGALEQHPRGGDQPDGVATE